MISGVSIKIEKDFWPPDSAFAPVQAKLEQGRQEARCTRIAVCNDVGEPCYSVRQGGWVHIFAEFAVSQDIQAPFAGVELATATGIVVHGKNTFSYEVDVPARVPSGNILRVHQSFQLRLAVGLYSVSVGLCSTSLDWLQHYLGGHCPYPEFALRAQEHCRHNSVAMLQIDWPENGGLSHHGIVDLPGDGSITTHPGDAAEPGACADSGQQCGPTLLHVTHWKAGSQWLYAILNSCGTPGTVVEPELHDVQVRCRPVKPGCIYPTVYLPKAEVDRIFLPPGSKIFVVIRDLRDTLISAYFSFKISHPIIGMDLIELRGILQKLDKEAGLLHLLENFLPLCAQIQLSWLESDSPVLKYEDLMQNDLELLSDLLIDRFRMPFNREKLRKAVESNRFEALSGGRSRGVEDLTAHTRKGVAGDWRNHFTDRIKKAFKTRYGGLLVAAGYERDLEW